MNRKFILGWLILFSFNSNAQVHLQTGAAQTSFPLYSYSDAKNNLSTSITLQYIAGNGIKVNDKATDVGLGWSLGAGGFIQRIQIGEPDDQNSTELFPPVPMCTNAGTFNGSNAFSEYSDAVNYVDNYFPNGYLFTEFPVNNGLNDCTIPCELAITPRFRAELNRKWKRSRRSTADRMQDIFTFSYNGRSGSFYIGRDGSILVLPDSKLQIEKYEENMLSQNIRTRISGFKITDEGGIEYKFNTIELNELMKQRISHKYTIDMFQGNQFLPTFGISTDTITWQPTGKYIVTRWMLTEIVNPRTNQKIQFTYLDQNVDYSSSIDVNMIFNKMEMFGIYNPPQSAPPPSAANIIDNRIIIKRKRISNILLSDGNRIELLYEGVPRIDEGGQLSAPLTQIRYLVNNLPNKKWHFFYKYFYKKEIISFTEAMAKTEQEKRFLRMCLISFQITSGDGNLKIPENKFSYYTGSESSDPNEIVPPNNCLAQDYWGYYTTPAFADLLTSKFPSTVEIPYLLRYDWSNPAVRSPKDGYAKLGMLKSITYPESGTITYIYEQNKAKTGVISKDGSSECVGGVRVMKTITSASENSTNDIVQEYIYEDAQGLSSGWGFEQINNLVRKTFKSYGNPGNYNIRGEENSATCEISFQEAARQGPSTITTMNKAFISSVKDQNLFPFFAAISVYIFEASDYHEEIITEASFYPLSLINPIETQYSRVTHKMRTGTTTDNGYTVAEFTDPVYLNSPIPQLNFPYESKMRYAPWKFGLLRKTTVYDKDDNKVNESEFFYKTAELERVHNSPNYLSIKLEPNVVKSFAYYEAIYNQTDITSSSFYPITGRVEIDKTIERSYKTGNLVPVSERTIEYGYHTNYMPNYKKETNSKGNIIEEYTYYPEDYSIDVLQAMNSNKIITPICTETWITKAGVTKMSGTTVNEFANVSGEFRVVSSYSLKSDGPVVFTSTTIDPAVLIRDISLIKSDNLVTYDNTGNSVIVQSKGMNVSTIFGYKNTLPIATISNAIISEAAYTSFEENAIGNWIYNNGSTTTEHGARTGLSAFNLSNTSTVTSSIYLNPSKNYFLSFWVKGDKPTLSGKTPGNATASITEISMVKHKSINGWDYYVGELQCNLPANIILTASSSNSCYLDELRLYPTDSRIATVTYITGVGKSSETDTNGRTTYYQYDSLGRLVLLLNENLDVIKSYEYKFKE